MSGSPSDEEAALVVAPPEGPRIDIVSMAGPGCDNADLKAIRIAAARDTFRIHFSNFTVRADRDTSTPESDCTVSIVLEGRDGVAYAPLPVGLEAETTTVASLSTRGYWSTTPANAVDDRSSFSLSGRHRTSALHEDAWSSCSGRRVFRFKLQLKLDVMAGRAELTHATDFRFRARSCLDAGLASSDAGEPLDAALPDAASATSFDAAAHDASFDADAGLSDGSVQTPAPLTIASVTTSGAACSSRTATVSIPEARDRFEVDFAQFVAETAPDIALADTTCRVGVRLTVPLGKTVAVERFLVRGVAALTPGATAYVSGFYSFLGGGEPSQEKQLVLKGPYTGAYEYAPEYGADEVVFRACDSAATVNLNLALLMQSNPSSPPSRISLDRVESARFVLRDCP